MAVALRLGVRLLLLIVGVFVSSVLVFGFMAVLPGDPAAVALGVNSSPEAIAALRTQFGLDRPLPVQYLDWIGGFLTFDLGESWISRTPIAPLISDGLQVSLWLVGVSMVLAMVIAVPFGCLMALRNGKPSGLLLSGISQVGMAVPAFLAGIVLVTVFAVKLRWLPAGGWTVPAQDPLGFLENLIMPALALALVQSAVLARYVRSAVLDVLGEDYLRTARAKGLRPVQALIRHGLRNAAIPVVTVLGLQLTTLIIGAVVIERVFVIPGIGSVLLNAVSSRDLIIVQNVVMVLVLIVLVINFLVDALYVVIDPRLRSSR
ncbi:ABC transporter permease [Naumannella halotolerans]|uniref:ABC transporter permease n=1 Tax=Naumannella halotolerans TaxID=993414 RepID=UPI00370DCAEC